MKKVKNLIKSEVELKAYRTYTRGFQLVRERGKLDHLTMNCIRRTFFRSSYYSPGKIEENEFLFSKMLQGFNKAIISVYGEKYTLTGSLDENIPLSIVNEKIQRTPISKLLKAKNNIVMTENQGLIQNKDRPEVKIFYKTRNRSDEIYIRRSVKKLDVSINLPDQTELLNEMLQREFHKLCSKKNINPLNNYKLYKVFVNSFNRRFSKSNDREIGNNIQPNVDCLGLKKTEMSNEVNSFKLALKNHLTGLKAINNIDEAILDFMNGYPDFVKETIESRVKFVDNLKNDRDFEGFLSKIRVENHESVIGPIDLTQSQLPVLTQKTSSEGESPNCKVQIKASAQDYSYTILLEKIEAFKQGVHFADIHAGFQLDEDSVRALIGNEFSDVFKKAFLVGYKKRLLEKSRLEESVENQIDKGPNRRFRFV